MERRGFYDLDIAQDYFHWLCEMVHIDQGNTSYWILAKDLHHIDFYSLVAHDENRALDGIELRDEYLSEINYPKYVDIEGECSVLEMIIALARRMDFETSDPYDLEESVDRTAFWFWEMLDNLGLTKFSDDAYVELEGQIYVEWIIDLLLERKYEPNGLGGLFPLDYCEEDQREVEIWYQMNAYLNERGVV